MRAQGDGILFPIDFSAANSDPAIKTFIDDYKAKFNADPSPYAADAYDAMQLIIKALAAGEEFEPDAIKAGMEKVAAQGFIGAAGKITFENRDARVPGVLVEWRDGKENVIQP
jgi:branched-chain amino acid transport system substrate-binding protein